MLSAAPVDPQPPPPSWWDETKDYAGEAVDIYDAPIADLAAVIGVSALWLGGLLVGLKFLTTGLWMLRQEVCEVPKRK